MFASALIVFREVLEAALIVGIVAAATRGIPRRSRWILGGVALGIVGALAVAGAADAMSRFAEGMGPELFNATILAVAVLMLAWHNIWMASHGRELSSNARAIGGEIRAGTRQLSVVLIVVAVAVLREGSETVLFLYGIAISESSSMGALAAGGVVGLLGGALVGYLLFRGLLRIPLKWFFGVTSALVLVLAAGMAAQSARFLIQADALPSLGAPVWDTSSWVSNSSIAGKVLQGLMGYDARPAGMQIAFFIAALVAIALGMAWSRRR